MRTERYYELAAKLTKDMDECGIKLDLDCPCDRAILTECGLTAEESLEFLGLFDAIQCDTDDDTARFVVGEYA
jgi:hypothetical protein